MAKTTTREKKYPEPQFITRQDRPVGQWTVEECAPKRGAAFSNNVDRMITAPVGSTPLERLVRAHELMHAKISPAEDWERWIQREVASRKAMVAVEEVRVNWGISKAGFNLNELTDGNEDADGEYCAIHKEWDNAVIFAVATAGTAGGKKFLVGVRRHNKQWAQALSFIQKKIIKEIKKDTKRGYGSVYSTQVSRFTGLAPLGFEWTERMAEYVDRLCLNEPKEQSPQKAKNKPGEGDSDKSEGLASIGAQTESTTPEEPVKEIIHDMEPLKKNGRGEEWGKLIWGTVPMPKKVNGKLGRKRVSSNIGRNPRRIHKLYTDPQRRVFDTVRRADGGIVLVDGSGSMNLSHRHVIDILESAPGALVAIYSDMDENRGKPNIHIIAKDGKTVHDENGLPLVGAGNGVDYPALLWAIKQRKNSKTPVIWVTDGGVCTPTGGFNDRLAMACIKTAMNNKVLVVENAEEAVEALKKLNGRQVVTRRWPVYFHQIIRRVGGISKVQEVKTAEIGVN